MRDVGFCRRDGDLRLVREETPRTVVGRLRVAAEFGVRYGIRYSFHILVELKGVPMMKKNLSYMDSVHRDGRLWGIVVGTLIMAVPFAVSLIFGVLPNGPVLVKGLLATAPMYWAVGIVEIFTYVPMLGAGGTYLSFITGNISNLKLPCAVDAMERAKVKPSSEEGEVISTIAIAVSSIVTTLIVLVGVICIVPLTPILESPVLKPAFDMILPALFGGLAVVFISKNAKLSIAPIILMLALFIFVPALNAGTVGIMVPVGVVFTVAVARLMYKKGWL